MAESITSALLAEAGFRHAFFTRRGGVSEPPFQSLNFSSSVGDDPAAVAENLGRAAGSLEIPRERLYFLSQVHGTVAHRLGGVAHTDVPTERAQLVQSTARGEVGARDGMAALQEDPGQAGHPGTTDTDEVHGPRGGQVQRVVGAHA